MPTLTLADLQTRVYGRLDANALLYTSGEVTRAVNDCLRCLNAHTGMLQGTVSGGATVSNQLVYSVPTGILVPFAVTFSGKALWRCSAQSVGLRWKTWKAQTSATFGPVARWVPLGIKSYALHPADAVGGAALKVSGILEPTALSGSTDVVSIPDEFVEAIVDLAAQVLPLKEGGKVFADSAVLYQAFLSRIKEWSRWTRYKNPRFWLQAQVPKKG